MERSIEEDLHINWEREVTKLSKEDEISISTKFFNNVELYIILSELFFNSSDPKFIRHLHIIISKLYKINSKYFFELDLFIDQSIPMHPLAYFIKLFMFHNTKEQEIQTKLKSVLLILLDSSYAVKKELMNVITNSFRYDGRKFLFNFNQDNISLIFQLFSETDSKKFKEIFDNITIYMLEMNYQFSTII